MIEKTSDKILQYIHRRGQASGKELADHLASITDRGIRKQLKTLLEQGKLRKVGTPPRVFYLLAIKTEHIVAPNITPRIKRLIDERYVFISPSGDFVLGWKGFQLWCQKTKQEPKKTAKEYVSTQMRYDKFRKDGVIDGTRKLKQTFDKVFLDKLFYVDFYSIERFGKTKLGQMLLYAKQSQDRALIRGVVDEVRPVFEGVIKKYAIDGVVYIPPTVKREVQYICWNAVFCPKNPIMHEKR